MTTTLIFVIERKSFMEKTIDEEMETFINKLREKNIPVIIEQDKPVIRKMFYKPQNCIWSGIYLLNDNEKHHSLQKYCELTLVERAGIITIGLYDKHIEGKYWENLDINEIDIYTRDTLEATKHFYEATRMNISGQNEHYPPYDLGTDIILKDCYMNMYIKQQGAIGKKFIYC